MSTVTESKHTSQKWERSGLLIYALYTPSGDRQQFFKNGKPLEANRFSACVQGDHSEASPEELEANARLIAAAPAMLEALERIIKVSHDVPKIRGGSLTGAECRALDQAAAAIKLAKGESQ